MKKYECVIVFDGLLSDEELKSLQERAEAIINSAGSEITAVHPWGKQRLAYEINKRTEGYYILYYFTAPDPAQVLPELERFCRIEEKILRHLVCHEVPSQFSKIMAEEKKKASEVEKKETGEEAPAEPEKTGEPDEPVTPSPEEATEKEPEETPDEEKSPGPEKDITEEAPPVSPAPVEKPPSEVKTGEPEKAPSSSSKEQSDTLEETSQKADQPEKKE